MKTRIRQSAWSFLILLWQFGWRATLLGMFAGAVLGALFVGAIVLVLALPGNPLAALAIALGGVGGALAGRRLRQRLEQRRGPDGVDPLFAPFIPWLGSMAGALVGAALIERGNMLWVGLWILGVGALVGGGAGLVAGLVTGLGSTVSVTLRLVPMRDEWSHRDTLQPVGATLGGLTTAVALGVVFWSTGLGVIFLAGVPAIIASAAFWWVGGQLAGWHWQAIQTSAPAADDAAGDGRVQPLVKPAGSR